MATPTVTSTLTTINVADANTGWTLLTTVDTDVKKQGTGALSGILRTTPTGYYTPGSPVNLSNTHVRIWFNTTTASYMDTYANGGIRLYLYDGTNTAYWYVAGNNTYAGGWMNMVVYTGLTPDSGTVNTSSVKRIGVSLGLTATPKNVINSWIDYVRYGDGLYATGGGSSDPIDLEGIYQNDKTNGYGILDSYEGIYIGYGDIQIGNGATTTVFSMLGDALVFSDAKVNTGLYKFRGLGSGCAIIVENSVLRSSGTTNSSRFTFDMSDSNLYEFNMYRSFINRAGECKFKYGQTVYGNTFIDCGQITANTDLRTCIVSGYEGTADTAAVIWTQNANPGVFLEGMSISKGTAATHAIEFGTTSPTTLDVKGITFNNYNASNGQNDSTLLISRTSGTVTINVIGCTGNVTYKSAGATVVLVIDPVTVNVTVTDIYDNAVVQGARVFLAVADGVNFPYQDTVTISRSDTTATVAHSLHGLSTGDIVFIDGSVQPEYNGSKTITYVDANSYSFTVAGSPTTPATGTITSTFVLIDGTTDSNGQISKSLSFSNDQPIAGRVRKASGTPFYKTSGIIGTVNSTAGLDINIQLLRDQ